MKSFLWFFGTSALVIIVVLIAGATVFFFQHRHVETVSARGAAVEFRDLRNRLGQQPPHPGQRLHSFHAVIFDTRGGDRLVRISMPYRLLRWAGRSQFQYLGQLTFLDDTEFDSQPIHLSLDQIEQQGPGVIVDSQRSSGGQFVAWVE